MESNPRKRKAPELYTPDLDPKELVDDISVDSNWENDDLYGDTAVSSTPKDDYECDSFLVSDSDSIEIDEDVEDEDVEDDEDDDYDDEDDDEDDEDVEDVDEVNPALETLN
jgi:ribonuclease E